MKWLWLTGLVIALDQFSKQLAEHKLVLHTPYAFIDGYFNFTLAYNKGIAFSFLSNAGGWQRWVFMALSAAISIFIFTWLRKVAHENRVLACGLALILGGAIGNLVDRTLFGHVIDFLQFYYPSSSCLPGFTAVSYGQLSACFWPTFNIADSAIFLGAGCLIVDMFKEYKNA
jgi:signal peptidase II